MKTRASHLHRGGFQNTCVVVTRGRRLVVTWATGLDYALMLCRVDAALDLLDKPLPYLEHDILCLYESLFCDR